MGLYQPVSYVIMLTDKTEEFIYISDNTTELKLSYFVNIYIIFWRQNRPCRECHKPETRRHGLHGLQRAEIK